MSERASNQGVRFGVELNAKNVRAVLNGQSMTASEIANAGGWSFDETLTFMRAVAVDEVEVRSGFEYFNKEGCGTAFKWVNGEQIKFKRAKNLSVDEQNRAVIEYLKSHPSCVIRAAKDTGLSKNQLNKTVARLVGLNVLKSRRDGALFIYDLAA